jgi:chromosome segregation ATPase
MTIEELERGMKMLFDQQVQFADDMVKAEQRQDRTDLQIAALGVKIDGLTDRVKVITERVGEITETVGEITETVGAITDSQTVTMRAITSVVGMIGDLTESQKRTDAIVATLGRRIDAYIAARGNGHQTSP